MRRFRNFASIAVFSALLALLACNGGDGPTTPAPTPPTTTTVPPTPPPAGSACTDFAAVAIWTGTTPSPAAGFQTRVSFTMEVEASTGLGANIDSIQAGLFSGNSANPDETVTLDGAQIAAQTGSSRIEGGQTRTFDVFFDSTLGQVLVAVITFSFTDDNGNQCQVDGGDHDTF